MKTTLLIDLHGKAMQSLDLIQRAENKQKRLAGWCAKYDRTTWENEHKIWGLMGKPSTKRAKETTHDLEVVTLALQRLVKYYKKQVAKIASFAEQTELEISN